MKSKRITNPFFVVVLSGFLLASLIAIFIIGFSLFRSDIIMLDQKPERFCICEESPNVLNYIAVEDAEDAVTLAKAYIRIIYDEPPSRHGPYYVYFDEEDQVYYIRAQGKLFDGGVDLIIKKATGELISCLHGKF
ncbi:MAG TPA: hypothetical protein PK629_09570 [Oscillospiraceae bacterium]|nr:hypothetical protein [Oscillospiraceae bacterium]HPF56235.1 hypothetical protein [Clostridiales bacterium]HPK34947.1 hypothetical protein [Oscillospiraceae bacterium]HPR75344.1 hypothetical protein [Oscillospiraceae bacterium]